MEYFTAEKMNEITPDTVSGTEKTNYKRSSKISNTGNRGGGVMIHKTFGVFFGQAVQLVRS